MLEKKEKNDKNKHYITAKESRNIAKQNLRTIKQLKKKRAAYTKDDYITEMKKIRHPYDKGIRARRGIEF